MARKKCEHGKRKYCRECHPIDFCEHGHQKHICKDCGGGSVCEHGRRRQFCKDCHGVSICEHNRQRHVCKECGGACICDHGRARNSCAICRPYSILNVYRHSARTRGYSFELTAPRFIWLLPKDCAYCGKPAYGVDRVKNEYGYTNLNAVPTCAVCNKMKLTHSAADFIVHVNRIAAYSPTYETFKQRWIATRTSGPDLGGINGSPEDNSLAHTS